LPEGLSHYGDQHIEEQNLGESSCNDEVDPYDLVRIFIIICFIVAKPNTVLMYQRINDTVSR
jgi:hypothetical protein